MQPPNKGSYNDDFNEEKIKYAARPDGKFPWEPFTETKPNLLEKVQQVLSYF